MPTTVSRQELDELRDLINEHIERTGESVTSLAKRAGITRPFMSQLRSGNYPFSPSFDNVKLAAEAIGKKIVWIDAEA